MSLHIMCLVSESGLPIFSKKHGDCEAVRISQTYTYTITTN